MKIAQIVFDLPLERPFDYLIPSSLEPRIAVGMRVQVFLGFKKRIGFVTGVIDKSAFDNLKSIKAIVDEKPLLDSAQLSFAKDFSRYYGCSLGEALFTMARGYGKQILSSSAINKNFSKTLHVVPSGDYTRVLLFLMKPLVSQKQKTLVLVPDQFMAAHIEEELKEHCSLQDYVIGTRSSVFRSLADIALVIMMEEADSSYKQEQTPMYETRDVLMMRTVREKFEIAFISTVASVEMMELVDRGFVQIKSHPPQEAVKCQAVDLNNHKVTSRWFLSPAVLSALGNNLSKGFKSVIVVNHLVGIEQLQESLRKAFPSAKLGVFKKGAKVLKSCDILIGTSALLRFTHQMKVKLVAFLDLDGELNLLDTRSCFRAWSLVHRFKVMAQDQFLIQTHQLDHYVVRSLAQDDVNFFYREDMRIRRELMLCPFGHQIVVSLRSTNQKSVQKKSEDFYQTLLKSVQREIKVHAPVQEAEISKKGQYRWNILMQGKDVIGMIDFIKVTLAQSKRAGKVIVTLNVDP